MRLIKVLALSVLVGTAVSGCSSLSLSHEGMNRENADHSSMTMETMDETALADHNMAMDLGPKDAEFDLRFIDGMILHHQGAVVMANSALQNSSRDEVKQLAREIIAAQQVEIEQMQKWRSAWYPDAGTEPVMYHAQMGHSMAMTPQMQAEMAMSGDLGKADAEFDLRFSNAMIPHHEGAVVMAEQVLEKSDRPELQQLAKEIIAAQQPEIDLMKQWRQAWYSK